MIPAGDVLGMLESTKTISPAPPRFRASICSMSTVGAPRPDSVASGSAGRRSSGLRADGEATYSPFERRLRCAALRTRVQPWWEEQLHLIL